MMKLKPRSVLPLALTAALAVGQFAVAQTAQPTPVPPVRVSKDDASRVRTTSLPARGLFKGEQLTELAKSRLVDLIIDAKGLDVEVALVIPTGRWEIDGSGANERDLTPARIEAVRRFLADRGVDPKRTFVESRIDQKATEARLDVQLAGRPSAD